MFHVDPCSGGHSKAVMTNFPVCPYFQSKIPLFERFGPYSGSKLVGKYVFIPSETSEEVSFIVIHKTALLAEINGTVFAPEDFKQHCQLATSTGVVPQSKQFNTTMVRFLSHLELAVPIENQKVIQLIDKHLDDKKIATLVGEQFLLCPALIRIEVPSQTLVCQSNFLYSFGRVLSSVCFEHFFDARFLHVLILRLALSLGLAPIVDPDIPALQHQCSVWKTGVCWSTSKGAEVLVEVLEKESHRSLSVGYSLM